MSSMDHKEFMIFDGPGLGILLSATKSAVKVSYLKLVLKVLLILSKPRMFLSSLSRHFAVAGRMQKVS
jgi:hypothetical protein